MRRALRSLFISAVALGLFASDAHAWVRSTTDGGTPVFWPGTCTWIFPADDGSPDLPFEKVVSVLAKSIANWQDATLKMGCSYLVMNQDPPATGEAHLDKKNVLKFRTDKWCRPAEKNNPEICYSDQAAAITTVFYTSDPGKADDGTIIDADIQMNDINFTFFIKEDGGTARFGTMLADLENTLTHELGHYQGLDHTCWDHSPPHQTTPPIDGNGNPVPDCNDVINNTGKLTAAQRATIENATMFNYAAPGEIIKRKPKTDDTTAICTIYAAAKDPMSCTRPDESKPGSCSVGSVAPLAVVNRDFNGVPDRGALAFGALTLVGGLVLAIRARRRKPR